MRATLYALMFTVVQGFAMNSLAQTSKISLTFENITLKQLLHEIENITEFRFLYNSKMVDLERQIWVNFKDTPLNEVLEILFKDSNIGYQTIDNQIVLFSMNDLIYNQKNNQPHRSVSGQVTNKDLEPLPGVTIVIKGTTRGTISDSQGNFSFSDVPVGAILLFSFVGMQTEEIAVTDQKFIRIQMGVDIIGLEEVIAIGYGTVKKGDLTGSVVRISNKDIREAGISHAVDLLAGTVPGLLSNQASDAAGGGSLEIRGPSSLSAGTEPLIVLDGVIFFGNIRDINPNDIESVDVLKDASSAAIFGAKAASGVILITTKKGDQGKPIINFSAKFGIAETTNDLKPYGMDNPREYLNAHRDYQRQRNPDQPEFYFFHPDDLPEYISIAEWLNYSANPADDPLDEWANRTLLWPVEFENYKAGKTTDFYDLVIGPALKQDYNLSVGGAREDVQYYLSIGYLNNEGIIKGDQYQAIRTRININQKITGWLRIGTNTHFSHRDESVLPANLNRMAQMSPYGSMWNENGTLRQYPLDYIIVRNPLEEYFNADKLKYINSLFSALFAEIDLPFGIQYKISYQPRLQFSKDYEFFSTDTHMGSVTYIGGRGTREESSLFEWMVDNLVKWNKKLGKHHVDLTLLANAERKKEWLSFLENSNFYPNDKLSYHGLAFGSNPGINAYDTESSGDALMARVNYSLSNKYLITGSLRRDGYSAFGQKNPRALFPALAFAWKADEEPFFKSEWINRMKLRFSWGINGNRDIGQYAALAKIGSIESFTLSGYEIGVYNASLANKELLWEETEAFNFGIDLGILNNRIEMNLDAYVGTTYNLLLDRQLPRITGFTSITSNLGELENKGIEASIQTKNVQSNKLTWRSSFVCTLNRNKIRKLWGDIGEYTLLGERRYGELPDFQNEWFPGYARDIIWDYEIEGVWQTDEIDQATKFGMSPGDLKATDHNLDDKYTQLQDKRFIGYKAPKIRLGFKNDFTLFSNITASIFIRADLGHLREMALLTQELSTFGLRNSWGIPYWSPENPTNDFPRLVWPGTLSQYGGGIRAFKPTGFVRVQDLHVAYNLPAATAGKLFVQGVRVSFFARNLLTFTNYPGFDPESGMNPMPRTYTLGIDLSL